MPSLSGAAGTQDLLGFLNGSFLRAKIITVSFCTEPLARHVVALTHSAWTCYMSMPFLCRIPASKCLVLASTVSRLLHRSSLRASSHPHADVAQQRSIEPREFQCAVPGRNSVLTLAALLTIQAGLSWLLCSWPINWCSVGRIADEFARLGIIWRAFKSFLCLLRRIAPALLLLWVGRRRFSSIAAPRSIFAEQRAAHFWFGVAPSHLPVRIDPARHFVFVKKNGVAFTISSAKRLACGRIRMFLQASLRQQSEHHTRTAACTPPTSLRMFFAVTPRRRWNVYQSTTWSHCAAQATDCGLPGLRVPAFRVCALLCRRFCNFDNVGRFSALSALLDLESEPTESQPASAAKFLRTMLFSRTFPHAYKLRVWSCCLSSRFQLRGINHLRVPEASIYFSRNRSLSTGQPSTGQPSGQPVAAIPHGGYNGGS